MSDKAIRVAEVPERATHVFHGFTKGKLRYETWIQTSHDFHVEEEVALLKRCGCDKVIVTKRPEPHL